MSGLTRRVGAVLRRLRASCAAVELLFVAHALRMTGRPVGVALVYHRVDEVAGDPRRELVPALAGRVFCRQLRLLRMGFELVEASRLAGRVRDRTRGRRIPLAITFDDDLECHERVTARLMGERGVPATFFLCGANLVGGHVYWWDALQSAANGAELGRALRSSAVPASVASRWTASCPESIHAVAAAILALSAAEREALSEHFADTLSSADDHERPLTVAAIRSLAQAGFEIGFHTLRHDYLPSLDDQGVMRALTDGREQLSDALGRPLRVIAYPHGAAGDRIAGIARSAGYTAGFTTSGAAVVSGEDELLLGRVECSYRSATDLAGRLLGVLRQGAGQYARTDDQRLNAASQAGAA